MPAPLTRAACLHCGTDFEYVRLRKPRVYCARICVRAAWRARNPGYNARYANKHLKAWRQGHRDEYNAAKRAWQSANRDKVREYQKRWRERHPEKARLCAAEGTRRRDQRRKLVVVVPFTMDQLSQRLSMFPGCWMCGGPKQEIDHVKPTAKGGPHMLSNLRPACRTCNARKKDKWPLAA